jgi:hypothetical protein
MNSIENEPLFTDLMPEQAAATQGGNNLCVYADFNFKGSSACTNSGFFKLPPGLDNNISSAIVRRGVWGFYDLPVYRNLLGYLGRGMYNFLGSFHNRTSSIRRIA